VTRSSFLTLYDYGHGGIWTIVLADSEDEIREAYPELEVMPRPPPWMTSDHLKLIRTVDLRDAEDPFLSSIRIQAGR
jgi:hypothetical protein